MIALPMPSPLARWWSARPAAARGRLRAIAIAAALALAVLGIAQPLARSADASRAALARDRAALAVAKARVDEIAALGRTSAPVTGDAKAELDRMLDQSGLRAPVTELVWQESRARLTFAAVEFDALVRLLETLQREAHLRIVEAKLVARVEPGTVRAELVLAR